MNMIMKPLTLLLFLGFAFQTHAMDKTNKINEIKKNKEYEEINLSDSDIDDLMNIPDEDFQTFREKKEKKKYVNQKLKNILGLDENKKIETSEILMMKENNLNLIISQDNKCQTKFSCALIQYKDEKDLIDTLISCGVDVNISKKKNASYSYAIYYLITHFIDIDDITMVKRLIALGAYYDVEMQFRWSTLSHLRTPLTELTRYKYSKNVLTLLKSLDQYKKSTPFQKIEHLNKIDDSNDQEMYLTITLNDEKTPVGVFYFLDKNIAKIDRIIHLMASNKNISLQYLPHIFLRHNITSKHLVNVEKNAFKYKDFKEATKNYFSWIRLINNILKIDNDCLANILNFFSSDDLKFIITSPKK